MVLKKLGTIFVLGHNGEMLNNLVYPGDWWIFIPSIASIVLLSRPVSRIPGQVLLVITTILITQRYGLGRGLVHILILYGLAFLFSTAYQQTQD